SSTFPPPPISPLFPYTTLFRSPFVRTNLHSTILSHFSETVDPPRAPTSIPQRGDGCPSRKQYICNCRNRYNSSDKLCKWYTHCAVMVWVTLLYIKAVR